MAGRLSLIAGSGALVPEVIAAARQRGLVLQVLSLVPRRRPAGVEFLRCDIADLRPVIEAIRRFGAAMVAMAGAIPLSDSRREALSGLMGAEQHAVGDTALSGLAAALERQTGARLVGAHEIAPQLLAPDGLIAGPTPSDALMESARFAVGMARRAGRLDVGQGLVVSGRRVLALEDIAGTDALLRRVGNYRRRGLAGDGTSALVFAKAAKPDQPHAIDMPAIGATTISNAAKAGIALIAVEAGKSLLIERTRLTRAAEAANLPVVGVTVADE